MFYKSSLKSLLSASLLLLGGASALPSSAGGEVSVEARDNTLELNVLCGSHVIYSYDGTTPPQRLMNLVSKGYVGGVILFGGNIDGNTASHMEALQEAYRNSPAPAILKRKTGHDGPLLIMTDQEGGQVRRLPGAPVQSPKEVGASSDPAGEGKSTGVGAAKVLKKYGQNLNLAPCMGVYRSEGDFLDYYGRSYGSSVSQVTSAAIPFIQGQQNHGVAATAKHFPGLGAASHSQNTDREPVTLNLPLSEIRSVNEAVFGAAINAGVDLVMASWAVYPALDDKPAGMSSKWIQGELRDRLGFQGVTITDTMEGGSIQSLGNRATRARMAAQAGMDLLMATGGTPSNGEDIRQALYDGMRAGTLDNVQFDGVTDRVMALRAKLA